MSEAHTPGPWLYGVRKDKSIWLSIGDPSGYHYQGDLVASEADARLIAAAPDLLAALDGLMTLESRGRIMPIGKEWDAARAARAKARESA